MNSISLSDVTIKLNHSFLIIFMTCKIRMKTDLGKIAFLLFLFTASYTFIPAQGLQVDFRTFTTQEGLADNNIHCILQDSSLVLRRACIATMDTT